jgi:hypothetical protein
MLNPPSTGTGPGAYRFFSFTEAGTGGPTLIGFEGHNQSDYYSIDGVVVTDLGTTPPGTAVPEPSSLTLLALGGAALAGWRRWRGKRPQNSPAA